MSKQNAIAQLNNLEKFRWPDSNAGYLKWRILKIVGMMSFSILIVLSFGQIQTVNAASTLSLAEWVERLAQEQPEAMGLQAQQQWSDAQTKQSQRWFGDNSHLRLAHESDQMNGSQGIENWEFGIGFSLWAWGQRQAQQDLASQSRQGSQLAASLLKLDMADVLRQAVWNYQRAQTDLQLAQQEHQVWQKLAAGVSQAVRAGEQSRLDQKLAEQAVLKSQVQLNQAQAQIQQAQAQLLSWGVDSEIVAYEESAASADWQAHPILSWQQNQLAQAQAQRQIATSQVSGQSSIELTAKQAKDKYTESNGSLELALTVPFGRGNRLAVAEAMQQQTTQQVALGKLKRQLHQAWLQASSQLELAQQQNSLARQQIELADLTLTMAQQAYQSGETNLTELLRVQQQALDSQRQAQLSQIEVHYRIALYNQSLGVLPK